ncbi:MAG TPA: ABC transporter permease, partial [Thermoanaerobaculia bacterium]|nr:ABC transporter permease [Thermoanaerobaculia bacterium]
MQDLRHAFRTLRKSPGFAVATVGILALGIGANTAIFSVVNAVLLQPLPLPAAEQLVKVTQVPPRSAAGPDGMAVSPADFADLRAGNRVFSAIAAYRGGAFTLTGTDRPESLSAATVSEDFFAVLSVQPRLGRIFTREEQEPGHDDVVILSHAFWQKRFGGDPRILGRVIRLDGRANTVIGVMGSDFRAPSWYPTIVEIWKPLATSAAERSVRNVRSRFVIARLRPGVSPAQAQVEISLLADRLARRYPGADQGWGAAVLPLREYLVRAVRPALLLLLAAVGFVLLIACANVANLVGVRSLGRSREMAIRSALGAGRFRLVRQLGAEALLLTVAGAALGLYLARFGVALIVGFLGDELPRGLIVHPDLRVLAFTLGISLLVGLVVALAPAGSLGRRDLARK